MVLTCSWLAGNNFSSMAEMFPCLEPCGSGTTALWARVAAWRYNCTVVAGYPEKADMATMTPTSPEYYNSVIAVGPEGETLASYSDGPWEDRFCAAVIPRLGQASLGRCKSP